MSAPQHDVLVVGDAVVGSGVGLAGDDDGGRQALASQVVFGARDGALVLAGDDQISAIVDRLAPDRALVQEGGLQEGQAGEA